MFKYPTEKGGRDYLFCSNYILLREDGFYPKWLGKTRNVLSDLPALEDEICALRKQMEQVFQEEQSFTAGNVIEISSMLDSKINEYMRSHDKKYHHHEEVNYTL